MTKFNPKTALDILSPLHTRAFKTLKRIAAGDNYRTVTRLRRVQALSDSFRHTKTLEDGHIIHGDGSYSPHDIDLLFTAGLLNKIITATERDEYYISNAGDVFVKGMLDIEKALEENDVVEWNAINRGSYTSTLKFAVKPNDTHLLITVNEGGVEAGFRLAKLTALSAAKQLNHYAKFGRLPGRFPEETEE